MNERFEELLGRYVEFRAKESEAREVKNSIAKEIDQLMTEENLTSIKVYITALEENYDCMYEERKTKKINYEVLRELLSDTLFDTVVKEDKYTYLKIAKEKKEKPVKEKK